VKTNAEQRTGSLFGDEPKRAPSFGAPERPRQGGFAEGAPEQVGMFGPKQMDIGDKERIERSANFREESAKSRPVRPERSDVRAKLMDELRAEDQLVGKAEREIDAAEVAIKAAKQAIVDAKKAAKKHEANGKRIRAKLRTLLR
jgi:hypothetical protein